VLNIHTTLNKRIEPEGTYLPCVFSSQNPNHGEIPLSRDHLRLQ
jgi:hypothetical protein